MARFQAGQSGNPRGRPTEHARAAAIRKQILKAAPDVVAGLIEAAKAGDSLAGRILLACACPPLKPVELPVCLPLPECADLADQGRAIISALSAGHIAPGQANAILQSLAGLARLVELTDIERRIQALEDQPTRAHPADFISVDDESLPE